MAYEFSFASLFWGIGLIALGVVFMRYHQVIADNLGSGWISYDKFKLAALLTCVLGFLVMFNLHFFLLINIFKMIFGIR